MLESDIVRRLTGHLSMVAPYVDCGPSQLISSCSRRGIVKRSQRRRTNSQMKRTEDYARGNRR